MSRTTSSTRIHLTSWERSFLWGVLWVLYWGFSGNWDGSSVVVAQTFTTRVATGLSSPVFGTAPATDPNRLFVVQKGSGSSALIRVLDLQTKTVLATPFLSVPNLVTSGERGLLGLAFHPDYSTNGKFYVYASTPGGPQDHHSEIREFRVSGDPLSSLVADPATSRLLMSFDQPFSNHNGGWIGFDPTATGGDRSHLYIATGDGGSGGDPQNNAQDITNNLLGKILRIDVDRDDFLAESRNYGIPPSNPFVDRTGDDEIFVYGLRNPFRNGFDRQTGDLWIGDVGQGDREEIDFVPARSEGGMNFGWRVLEGTRCNDNSQAGGNPTCNNPTLVPPVVEYSHGSGTNQGNSVTGGYLYRGSVPQFQGHYFFADFVSGNLWTLDPHSDRPVFRQRNSLLRTATGEVPSSVASFAEDQRGELYIMGIGGSIFRVDSTSRQAVWNPSAGVPGDGRLWSDAQNWIRDQVADVGFVPQDHVVLGAGETRTMSLTESQTVSALSFRGSADFQLKLENSASLRLVSGNVFVEDRAMQASVEGILSPGEVGNSIRKLGPGGLSLDAPPILAVLEGTAKVQMSGKTAEFRVSNGAVLELSTLGSGRGTHGARQLTVLDQGTVRMFANSLARDWLAFDILEGEATAGELDVVAPTEHVFPTKFGQWFGFPLWSGDVAGSFSKTTWGNASLGRKNLGAQGAGHFIRLSAVPIGNETVMALFDFRAYQGDTDGNRIVDFADFFVLSEHFGMQGINVGWSSGDFDGNQGVEFADFLNLAANFGRELSIDLAASSSPAAGREVSETASVPEPGNGWMAVASFWYMLFRKRTRLSRQRRERAPGFRVR